MNIKIIAKIEGCLKKRRKHQKLRKHSGCLFKETLSGGANLPSKYITKI